MRHSASFCCIVGAQDLPDETVYIGELGSHFNTDGFAQETVDYMLPGEKELIPDWNGADSSMMPPAHILFSTQNDQYQGDYPYIFSFISILLSRANKDRIKWLGVRVKQWLCGTSDAVGGGHLLQVEIFPWLFKSIGNMPLWNIFQVQRRMI